MSEFAILDRKSLTERTRLVTAAMTGGLYLAAVDDPNPGVALVVFGVTWALNPLVTLPALNVLAATDVPARDIVGTRFLA